MCVSEGARAAARLHYQVGAETAQRHSALLHRRRLRKASPVQTANELGLLPSEHAGDDATCSAAHRKQQVRERCRSALDVGCASPLLSVVFARHLWHVIWRAWCKKRCKWQRAVCRSNSRTIERSAKRLLQSGCRYLRPRSGAHQLLQPIGAQVAYQVRLSGTPCR